MLLGFFKHQTLHINMLRINGNFQLTAELQSSRSLSEVAERPFCPADDMETPKPGLYQPKIVDLLMLWDSPALLQ